MKFIFVVTDAALSGMRQQKLATSFKKLISKPANKLSKSLQNGTEMQDPKQLVQRKIRQLVFLHAHYVESMYGKIPVDQEREYQRIYADWQVGLATLKDIQADINEYLKLREQA
jgi:cysteinyl-tRNA synthetase